MTCGVCRCDGGRGGESSLEMQTLDLREPGVLSPPDHRLPCPSDPIFHIFLSFFIAILGDCSKGKDLRHSGHRSGYRVMRGFFFFY